MRGKGDCVFPPPSRVLFSKSEFTLHEKSMEGEEWRTMPGEVSKNF